MTTWLTDLTIQRVALVDFPANPEAEVQLFKMASASTADTGASAINDPDRTAGEPDDHGGPMADEMIDKAEHDATVATLTKERDDLAAKVTELEAAAAPADTDEIDKSALPEAVRKALEDKDALEARVAKMEREQRVSAFTAIAKADYENVGAADELGPALEEVDRLAPDAAKVITQTLKAASARLADSGLFAEIGSAGDDTGSGSKAEALINAEVEKGMPRHEAISKVFGDNPELWQEAANSK